MADPWLDVAGYVPSAIQYKQIVSGDSTNNNLQILPNAPNDVRRLSFTIPTPVRIDLLQLDLTVITQSASGIVNYRVKLNESDLFFGSTNTFNDNTLLPLLLYRGAIGNVLSLNRGDILTLEVSGAVGGGGFCTIAGSLSSFGAFV